MKKTIETTTATVNVYEYLVSDGLYTSVLSGMVAKAKQDQMSKIAGDLLSGWCNPTREDSIKADIVSYTVSDVMTVYRYGIPCNPSTPSQDDMYQVGAWDNDNKSWSYNDMYYWQGTGKTPVTSKTEYESKVLRGEIIPLDWTTDTASPAYMVRHNPVTLAWGNIQMLINAGRGRQGDCPVDTVLHAVADGHDEDGNTIYKDVSSRPEFSQDLFDSNDYAVSMELEQIVWEYEHPDTDTERTPYDKGRKAPKKSMVIDAVNIIKCKRNNPEWTLETIGKIIHLSYDRVKYVWKDFMDFYKGTHRRVDTFWCPVSTWQDEMLPVKTYGVTQDKTNTNGLLVVCTDSKLERVHVPCTTYKRAYTKTRVRETDSTTGTVKYRTVYRDRDGVEIERAPRTKGKEWSYFLPVVINDYKVVHRPKMATPTIKIDLLTVPKMQVFTPDKTYRTTCRVYNMSGLVASVKRWRRMLDEIEINLPLLIDDTDISNVPSWVVREQVLDKVDFYRRLLNLAPVERQQGRKAKRAGRVTVNNTPDRIDADKVREWLARHPQKIKGRQPDQTGHVRVEHDGYVSVEEGYSFQCDWKYATGQHDTNKVWGHDTAYTANVSGYNDPVAGLTKTLHLSK